MDNKCRERHKRLRDRRSQTDKETHRIQALNSPWFALLLLAACSEIESLKKEIGELRGEVKSLKESLEFAMKEITKLRTEMVKTSTTVKENAKGIESFHADM